jgi:hypothetical protein
MKNKLFNFKNWIDIDYIVVCLIYSFLFFMISIMILVSNKIFNYLIFKIGFYISIFMCFILFFLGLYWYCENYEKRQKIN